MSSSLEGGRIIEKKKKREREGPPLFPDNGGPSLGVCLCGWSFKKKKKNFFFSFMKKGGRARISMARINIPDRFFLFVFSFLCVVRHHTISLPRSSSTREKTKTMATH